MKTGLAHSIAASPIPPLFYILLVTTMLPT